MNDQLAQLIDGGYRLIPLRSGEHAKKPRDEGYSDKNYALHELTGNVGLLIDPDHVDVDLDWPETQHLAGLFPATDCWFGRGDPCRVRHLVYRAKVKEPVDFRLPKVSGHTLIGEHAYTVLQLRASRGGEPYHLMLPPSVHPSGEKLEWFWRDNDQSEPASVLPSDSDGEKLVERGGLIAALAFFWRFYPGEGSRDEFALALNGALLRGGWSDEQIEWFVTRLATVAGDEEAETRVKVVASRKRLEHGRTVRGLPMLAKLLGVPIEWVREVACWLGIRKATSGGSPGVFLGGTTPEIARQAWKALEDHTIGHDPAVYAYGDALARINRDQIETLDRDRLHHELNRCARWLRLDDKERWVPVDAPLAVVRDMLSARASDLTVAPLVSVARTPIFTRSGKLVSERGYDWDSRIYVAPSVEVHVPDAPTADQVRQAIAVLLEPLQDFPFVDQSDRANVLAMMIEPYVRDHFECAPLYFINKPAAGTGASLLVHAVTYPTLGCAPPTTKPPTREDEMEKFLMAALMEGASVILLDNANHLDSSALAAALTSELHKGRVLGASRTVAVPVRCLWIATGNNTDTTNEMYRRFVDIRLDAGMEFPEDRQATAFSIPDLKGWVRENRAQLVSAALTVVQAWVRAGMPRGSKNKASFESWAGVMSGIFENAGVVGFLDTPVTRRPLDEKTEEMRGVIAQWFNLARASERGRIHPVATQLPEVAKVAWHKPVKSSELATMIDRLGLSFERQGSDAAQAVSKKLKHYLDRPFEVEGASSEIIKIVLRSRMMQNSTRWWLEVSDGRGDTGDAAADAPSQPPF